MTDKECGNNERLEQNKVLLSSSLAFYLALQIYNKELNNCYFALLKWKQWVVEIVALLHVRWISYYKS